MRLRKKLAAGVVATSIAVLGGGLAGVPATASATTHSQQGQEGEGFQGQFGDTQGNVSPGQQTGQQD